MALSETEIEIITNACHEWEDDITTIRDEFGKQPSDFLELDKLRAVVGLPVLTTPESLVEIMGQQKWAETLIEKLNQVRNGDAAPQDVIDFMRGTR